MAGKFLMTMKDYPPSETAGSFNLTKMQKQIEAEWAASSPTFGAGGSTEPPASSLVHDRAGTRSIWVRLRSAESSIERTQP